MSDEILDEAQQRVASEAGDWPNPHLLSYDFFKHMTSLSVLTLGGMLTLSGSLFAVAIEPERLLLSMVLIAAAGAIAFTGQVEMVEWANRRSGKPGLVARWGRTLVAFTYGGGIGAFLNTAYSGLAQ